MLLILFKMLHWITLLWIVFVAYLLKIGLAHLGVPILSIYNTCFFQIILQISKNNLKFS